MSAACSGTSEHNFLCPICLEVFTDPVSTPCKHNFCKSCINTHWDTSVGFTCPMCKKEFTTRPELNINTLISEMVSRGRRESMAPGEVPCDVCTGTKVKALKSCLSCVLSFCDTHLTASCLRRHQLVEPVENLEMKMKRIKDMMMMKEMKEMKKMKRIKMKRMKIMKEMKMMQRFAVDVTLDPLTAHSDLVLSDDGKQVSHSDVRKNLPDNPERFYYCISVLGKQSLSSGRFYFEVQVKGKMEWALGVVKESIDRKGYVSMSPECGCWAVMLMGGNEYVAGEDAPVFFHPKCVPEKVGVLVDYERGVVSFYDVDAAALIYSFTNCCLTHKLHPFFSPGFNYGGKNSAPLIICPVNQSE